MQELSLPRVDQSPIGHPNLVGPEKRAVKDPTQPRILYLCRLGSAKFSEAQLRNYLDEEQPPVSAYA